VTPTQPRASILLAEDDPAVAAMLKDVLEIKGYDVWPAESGAEVQAILRDAVPDLIILDLVLPDANGLVLFLDIKERAEIPVIFCSGTKRKEDPVLGLRLGAEDFISKPFSPQELQARIEAVLRRTRARRGSDTAASSGGCQRFGSLQVDRGRCRVSVGEVELQLTPTEYRLLSQLVTRGDEVVAKKDLAESVWGNYDPDIGRTLDVHMRRLRAKLSAVGDHAPRLETVRSFGYRLTHAG
jgi:two-component system, OmpR family, phosphate regulon response regulator PhoB